MRDYFLIIFISIFCASAFSDNFSNGVDFANNRIANAKNANANFNPNQFQHYTNNPAETQYYQNGSSDAAIKNATPNAISQSDNAQNIETNFSKDQAYQVNPSAPEIQKSNLVQTDSYNITHGISDQYVKCVPKNKDHCVVNYTQKICTSVTPTKLTCDVTPQVTINNVPYQAEATYTGSVSPQNATSGTFTLPESGIMQSFSVTLKSPNIWRCNSNYQGYLNNQYLSTYYPNCGRNLGELSFSSNNLSISIVQNQPISFQIKNGPAFGNWSSANYSVTALVMRYKQVASVTYQNSCGNVPQVCVLLKSACLSLGGNKIFDGVTVYEPCWNTQNNYLCGPADDHSCDSLINAGCSSINLQCSNTFNNTCVQYQNTMSCPTQTCTSHAEICGDNSFCTDGTCYDPNPTQNKNFGADEAKLAAAGSSADSVSQNQGSLTAFTGSSMSCSMAPIGFLNCCANSGWGKDIDLANCSDEEKQLGIARQNNTAIYIGEYCAHKVLGVCTAHRKSFCVFNGLLATDIQSQGRLSQLDIGFGDAKTPNCSGLSAQELQKIDFSKIDFSNLEASLKNQANFPNKAAVSQYIANKIKQEMGDKNQ